MSWPPAGRVRSLTVSDAVRTAAHVAAYDLFEAVQAAEHEAAVATVPNLLAEAERCGWTEVALVVSAAEMVHRLSHPGDHRVDAALVHGLVRRAELLQAPALLALALGLRALWSSTQGATGGPAGRRVPGDRAARRRDAAAAGPVLRPRRRRSLAEQPAAVGAGGRALLGRCGGDALGGTDGDRAADQPRPHPGRVGARPDRGRGLRGCDGPLGRGRRCRARRSRRGPAAPVATRRRRPRRRGRRPRRWSPRAVADRSRRAPHRPRPRRGRRGAAAGRRRGRPHLRAGRPS